MKKIFLTSWGILALVGVGFAGEMLLLETYQSGVLNTDQSEVVDTTLLELEFSVDLDCYAVFSTGGFHRHGIMWCVLDGESLPHTTRQASLGEPEHPLDQTYMCMLNAGSHKMNLRWRNQPTFPCWIKNGRLQALIFLPDTSTNAVAEEPEGGGQPTGNTPSLISKGPYVNVAGASELVDASGRVIEGAISDDKVFISNLPTGTYFARNGERTVVKIVKVQ